MLLKSVHHKRMDGFYQGVLWILRYVTVKRRWVVSEDVFCSVLQLAHRILQRKTRQRKSPCGIGYIFEKYYGTTLGRAGLTFCGYGNHGPSC